MKRRMFLKFSAFATALIAKQGKSQPRLVKDVSEQLAAIQRQFGFPGIASAVVRGNSIVAEGVGGVRRVGEEEKIALDDRFAMALCTKKTTAAMIARVINTGKLGFETTLAEALPDILMRGEYREVTVTQLLQFSGGIQPYLFFEPRQAAKLGALRGSKGQKREQFVRMVLQEEPVVKPGTERRCSNASYAVVAMVAEQRMGQSWEELMRTEVFEPLGMSTSGFGRPRTKYRPNEPTLHRKIDAGFEPEPDDRDNVMGGVCPGWGRALLDS